MATTIERRRQQNRLAQRRYRQRRHQIATDLIWQTSLNVASPVFVLPPLPVEATGTSEQSPPCSTYAPATVDSTKSFCELIADSANPLLSGLGTINMDDVELPSFVAGRQTSSSGVSPTLSEVVDIVSNSKIHTRASSSSINANKTDLTSQGNDGDAHTGKGWVTPLHMAARKGRDKIVRTLLQHNADCNQRDGDGLTPLVHASIGGHTETVTLLLSHGASIELVDRQSRSAVHWVVAQKQEAALRVLLENGGDKPSIMEKYDNSGMTPLHIAVDSDFEAGVQLLLQFGASVSGQARLKKCD